MKKQDLAAEELHTNVSVKCVVLVADIFWRLLAP